MGRNGPSHSGDTYGLYLLGGWAGGCGLATIRGKDT